jgi:hypothetical protein
MLARIHECTTRTRCHEAVPRHELSGSQGDRALRWMRARLARIHSQSIHRTLHAQGATVHHVEIRHGRPDVAMTEQVLHRANVVPIFK